MGALIDTSVLIAAERGLLDLEALLNSHAKESIAISAITASELLHGVHRLKSAVRRAHAPMRARATLRQPRSGRSPATDWRD